MTKTKMAMAAMALGALAVLPMQAQADQWAPSNIQATVKGMKATASKMASANPVKAVSVAETKSNAALVQGDAVDSLISRMDALNRKLANQVISIFDEFGTVVDLGCQDNPEVSSEKGLECLNLQNQFLQDYGKYVTRLRALKLFTAAMLGTGDAREPGIYQSLDLTQALQIRNRLAADIFFIHTNFPSRRRWSRKFYIPNGAGSEQLGSDLAKIGALSDEEEKDVNFIISRYLTVVCGGGFASSHETLARPSFRETAAPVVQFDQFNALKGFSLKLCGKLKKEKRRIKLPRRGSFR